MDAELTAHPGGAADALELAARHSPALRACLDEHGGQSLGAFVRTFAPSPPPWATRACEDLWPVIATHIEALYGAETARVAVAELRADPLIPTSNHFGVDTFADSVHGTLLFGMRPLPQGRPRRTTVILGCSSVSMDNLTYPMGLLLYEPGAGQHSAVPLRLPLYPNRYRRWTAGSVPPLTAPMVERASRRLAASEREGRIGAATARTTRGFLRDDLGRAGVLDLPRYGMQAAAINTALWSRLLPAGGPRPVHLALEAVCADVAARDVRRPNSLLSLLCFDPGVRSAVLRLLDGQLACWRLDGLDRRLARPAGGQSREGTVFFWGMREDGRRVPLTHRTRGGQSWLEGRDERGEEMRQPLAPEALAESLAQGRLVPSLLTCFAVLAFARGLTCVGGYYQTGYLPAMRDAVASAVSMVDAPMAERIREVPAAVHLAGLQCAVLVTRAGASGTAGPLELIAGGGLTPALLQRVRGIPVATAQAAALLEVLPHVVARTELPDHWRPWAAEALRARGGGTVPRLRLREGTALSDHAREAATST
ncbi:hypothetical protein [Streptomyces sp. NPDC086838]|uniref:hypothetical protein n=1 Tax=Streptomyces sp. NPDC086838 TaxID=3365762 RepID=UPI0038041246